MSSLFALVQSIILCGTLTLITLFVLLALPQSHLRKVFCKVAPFLVAFLNGWLGARKRPPSVDSPINSSAPNSRFHARKED